MLTFQDLIFKLQKFWTNYGCVLIQPYDLEMGAATFHPSTFLKSLGKDKWKAIYVQTCRRPSDGRFGKNPNRLQQYFQLQVLIKPSPEESQNMYLKSLEYIGIDTKKNDIKFVEDDWESPTLGAAGMGWEVQCNGMEISQFTYFQRIGGIECPLVSVELTYGLERIAMFIQNIDNAFDIRWSDNNVKYGDLFLENEKEFSEYNFNLASTDVLLNDFRNCEENCKKLLEKKLVLPAYEQCIKASHHFNLLDSRGSISVSERQLYILRIRNLSKSCCEVWLEKNA